MECPLCMNEATELDRKALNNGYTKVLCKCLLHGQFTWFVSPGCKKFMGFDSAKKVSIPAEPTPRKTFAERIDWYRTNRTAPRGNIKWLAPKKVQVKIL